MRFSDIFTLNKTLADLKSTLVPFAQQNTETDTGVPDKAAEMGFNGQIGNISEPEDNRGVSGIQLKRSFYNIFFRKLTAGLPVLTDTLSSLYKFFIRDYCMNDRKYTADLKDYYLAGDVSYEEQNGRFLHNQLGSTGWQPLTLLHDRGKTVLGYPSIWPGTYIPSWAIDLSSHTTYNWADYPNIYFNDTLRVMFKSFLYSLRDFGASGWAGGAVTFTAPDLRGISPAVWAGSAGAFLASSAGQHSHAWGTLASSSISSVSVSHDHPSSSFSPAMPSHTHSAAARKFATLRGLTASLSGENKAQGTNAYTSTDGAHTHSVSFGSGTEQHWHSGTVTPTVDTAVQGNNAGTISRVNTYPVHLIVRVE